MTKDEQIILLKAAVVVGVAGNLAGVYVMYKYEQQMKRMARRLEQASEVIRIVEPDVAANPKASEAIAFFLIENEETK